MEDTDEAIILGGLQSTDRMVMKMEGKNILKLHMDSVQIVKQRHTCNLAEMNQLQKDVLCLCRLLA